METGQGEYDDFNDIVYQTLQHIEAKMEEMVKLSLSITSKTVYLIDVFCDRLIRAVIQNNLDKDSIDGF